MRINDAIAGVLFLAFGLVVIAMSWQFPSIPSQPYGASTFPVLIGSGFVLVSLVLIAKGVLESSVLPGYEVAEWGRSRRALLRMALTVLLVALYIAFSEQIGFVISSFVVLVTLLLVTRVRLLVSVPIALLATLAIQQAFGVVLRVPLPRSEIFNFLW